MSNTDRLLQFGGILSAPAARFALVAALGVIAADLLAALQATAAGPAVRRAATLRGILGAAALLGFFWAFESARTWQLSGFGAGARATSLGLIGVSLVRPLGRTAWLATLAIGGTFAYLALLSSALRTGIASPTALAPLLGGLLLLAAEPFLPRRLQGLARALGSMLLLVLLTLVFNSSRRT